MKTLVSDDFSYSGTFSLTDRTANGYPIWSREHPEGHMLYIYLHDNGYIHVYHESSVGIYITHVRKIDQTNFVCMGRYSMIIPTKVVQMLPFGDKELTRLHVHMIKVLISDTGMENWLLQMTPKFG